jgi:hypothetical protein
MPDSLTDPNFANSAHSIKETVAAANERPRDGPHEAVFFVAFVTFVVCLV